MASGRRVRVYDQREVMAAAGGGRGNAPAVCEEIVATAYDHWATEDSRSDVTRAVSSPRAAPRMEPTWTISLVKISEA